MESRNWFTNAVGALTTTLMPLEVLRILLGVEAEFGRRRPENISGYQDRSLDLDLLYFGDIVMDSEDLILPHPHIAERLFVLKPLAELEQIFYDHARGLRAEEMVDQLQMKFATKERELQEITRSSWEE
jgi:7,8-dihydro-6-hydroxymethylpterin-pyrophosphokinase